MVGCPVCTMEPPLRVVLPPRPVVHMLIAVPALIVARAEETDTSGICTLE